MNRILEVCLVAAALATSIPSSAGGMKPATGATAQALQRGISVQMPVTSRAVPMPEADNRDAWIITVTADGDIDFGIDPVSPAALADEMKARPRNREQKLYIKADARAPYADVEKVLQAGHTALFDAPVLLTSQPGRIESGPIESGSTESRSSEAGTMASPKGLEVLLVPPAGSQPTEVHIGNSGQHTPILSINSRQIPWANLQNMLTQFFQSHPEKVILVKADGQLPFADIVHVIDVCHSVGAKIVLVVPGV
jgi:biopolymer transport protein ExbD